MTEYSEHISPEVIRKIAKEMQELVKNPIEGIKVFLNEEDITDVQATLEGPADTPYEGGIFKMKLRLGSDFPKAPPKAFFLTKIFHPNVSKKGEICVNTLKKDWKEDLGIKHILLTIKCLMIVPNPESSLNEDASRIMLDDYADYCKQAKLFTSIHAKKVSDKSEDSSSSSSSVNNENNSDNVPSPSSSSSSSKAEDKLAAEKKKVVADKKATEKKKSLKRL
eukprot:TRINITY_DN2374_c0_g1_i1.p1 TRINITY_DN2374_c0_g1~~TRINITY_DN2374_c0_g1_i1.p1  ORF type:complete len:222 (+),score=81.90 TRINITY_DN2374_c0_g1_i1:67-732(+)